MFSESRNKALRQFIEFSTAKGVENFVDVDDIEEVIEVPGYEYIDSVNAIKKIKKNTDISQ